MGPYLGGAGRFVVLLQRHIYQCIIIYGIDESNTQCRGRLAVQEDARQLVTVKEGEVANLGNTLGHIHLSFQPGATAKRIFADARDGVGNGELSEVLTLMFLKVVTINTDDSVVGGGIHATVANLRHGVFGALILCNVII